MKRLFYMTVSMLLFLTACGTEKSVATLPEPTPDQEMASSVYNLTITLEETTYTNATPEIHTTLQNENNEEFQYGDFFHVEHLKDGKWYMITYPDSVFFKNKNFTDAGYILPATSEAEQKFSVDILEVELTPGEYRLVKTFLATDGSKNEYALAAPFTIE